MHISYPNILLDGLENGVIVLDEDFTVHYWNLWMEINTRIKANDIMENRLVDYFDEIDYTVLLRKIRTALRLDSAAFYSGSGNKKFMTIHRNKVTNSLLDTMQLKVTVTPYVIEEKKVMISIYDVSEMAEAKLLLQKEIAKSNAINTQLQEDKKIIDNNLMILRLDTNCKILEVSRALSNFFNYDPKTLIGKSPLEFYDKSDMFTLQSDIKKVLMNKKTWKGEIKSVAIHGKSYWLDTIMTPILDEDGDILNITAIYTDITDKKRIEELSITDTLTKLHNRYHFNTIMDELIINHRKTDKVSTLILMDIDHFKQVNDIYGHQKGDEVLIKMAQILSNSVRKSDFIDRWGGEEFVILLPDIDAKTGEKVAQKIRQKIESTPFEDIGYITSSFGVTQYIDGDTKESMFARVDEALYRAKSQGRNRVVVA